MSHGEEVSETSATHFLQGSTFCPRRFFFKKTHCCPNSVRQQDASVTRATPRNTASAEQVLRICPECVRPHDASVTRATPRNTASAEQVLRICPECVRPHDASVTRATPRNSCSAEQVFEDLPKECSPIKTLALPRQRFDIHFCPKLVHVLAHIICFCGACLQSET